MLLLYIVISSQVYLSCITVIERFEEGCRIVHLLQSNLHTH